MQKILMKPRALSLPRYSEERAEENMSGDIIGIGIRGFLLFVSDIGDRPPSTDPTTKTNEFPRDQLLTIYPGAGRDWTVRGF
jgi:hypothetical protein